MTWYDDIMSRRYRRNGTPIGKYKVYALAMNQGREAKVFEVIPSGIDTYEDLESLVMLEIIEGKFGAPERLVITKPGVDLSGTDLYGANLSGANLSGANLIMSVLMYSEIRGADLAKARLAEAYLRSADLRGSNLRGADISGVDLLGADLTGTDLTDVLYDEYTYWPTGFTPHPSRDGYRPNRRRLDRLPMEATDMAPW